MKTITAMMDHVDHRMFWVILRDNQSHYTLIQVVDGQVRSRERMSIREIRKRLYWNHKGLPELVSN